MRKPLLILVFIAGLFTPLTAFAHQPEYIDTQTAITIPDADTSRAYYGELTGKPAIYTVHSDKQFSLYVNILSPYISGARQDFIVRIIDESGATIATLNSPAVSWEKWYEEFAGDTYWKGPEYKEELPSGTYVITVANPSNTGKYVLAPGEAETFTVAGTPRTIKEIYLVKTHFFGKSWFSIFEGIIGKFMLGVVVVLALVIVLAAYLIVKSRRKKKQFTSAIN